MGVKSKAFKYYKVFTFADGYHVSVAEELEISQFYIELGEAFKNLDFGGIPAGEPMWFQFYFADDDEPYGVAFYYE